MIEIKARTHSLRLYADRTRLTDWIWPVLYCGFRGDLTVVPRMFKVIRSNSCATDLSQGIDAIFSQMNSTTRNEIRRAEREGCSFAVVDDVDRFVAFYNSFCRDKGLADFTSRSRIEKFRHVVITEVRHGKKVLAMHANVLDQCGHMAFLLYSCSPRLEEQVDKKLIGWGNRYLHFQDLKWLKEHGYTYYDWSGVVMDPADERYSIGQFKLSFGGVLIDSVTIKTPVFRLLECVRDKIVSLRR